MKRLTYQTVCDATHPRHYCHGPGIKKDDLLQRLGLLEDSINRITSVIRTEPSAPKALKDIENVIDALERKTG